MTSKSSRLKLYFINFLPLIFVFIFSLTPQPQVISKTWRDILTLERSSQPDLLIDRYQSLIVQQPWQTAVSEKLVVLLYQNKQFVQAIDVLNAHARVKPLSVSQQFMLADAYSQILESEQAAQTWQAINQRSDLVPEDYARLLENQEENRDWVGAYATIQRWVVLDPQNQQLEYRSAIYQLIFDPPAAQAPLLTLFSAKPPLSESAQRLNAALQKIQLEDDRTFQLVLAGNALSNEGEWLLASCAFEEATKSNPNYAEAWAFWGNAAGFLGENGYPQLSEAYKLNPDSTVVQAYLAVYWRNQSDFGQSLFIFEKLAGQEPQEAYWSYEIAKTRAQSGDLQQALTDYQRAISHDPQNIFYWKAVISFTLDYSFLIETEGMEAARQALIIAPEDADVNDLMGLVFLRLENYSSAERFLIKSNKLQPYGALIQYHLGQLYYAQGENNLAYFYLKNAFDFAQNQAIADAASNLLARIEAAN